MIPLCLLGMLGSAYMLADGAKPQWLFGLILVLCLIPIIRESNRV